jgi:hypothetical protein
MKSRKLAEWGNFALSPVTGIMAQKWAEWQGGEVVKWQRNIITCNSAT